MQKLVSLALFLVALMGATHVPTSQAITLGMDSTSVTAAQNIDYNWGAVSVDATLDNVYLTFLADGNDADSTIYVVTRADNSSNIVTLAATSPYTIDGEASITVDPLQTVMVMAFQHNWVLVAGHAYA